MWQVVVDKYISDIDDMSELESVTIYYLKFTVKMSWVYHYLIHISET